jgi:hypothetical protein
VAAGFQLPRLPPALVNAFYNLLLFALMMWGTGEFKILDKL